MAGRRKSAKRSKREKRDWKLIELVLATIEARESAAERERADTVVALDRAWAEVRYGYPPGFFDSLLSRGLSPTQVIDALRASTRLERRM